MALKGAFARVCRACLQASSDDAAMAPLFESDLQLTRDAHALLTFATITIDPTDTFPQQICQKCLDCLHQALMFRLTCERSYRYLQHITMTQTDIVPEVIYTDFQNSVFADMTPSTLDNTVEVKIESVDFERPLNTVGVKMESSKDFDTEDAQEMSANNFLYFTVENNSEPPNTQEKVHMPRLSVTPNESSMGKHVKDKLTAAELRLRDLIFKTDRHESNKRVITLQKELRKTVTLKPDQVIEHKHVAPVTAQNTFTHIQSTQAWKSVLAEKKPNTAVGEKMKKLKESLRKYLEMDPESQKTKTKLPKRNMTRRDELECKICDKTYSCNNALRAHMVRHTPSVVCEHCGRAFGAKSELKFHCMARHGHKRNYHCGHCGHQVMTRLQLIEHIRLHTGERPFTCETCGLTFRRKDILRQHRLRHFEKQFKCGECDRSYYQQGHLNEHVRTYHRRLPPRRFRCTQPGCDASYVKIHNMRKHLAGKHKIPREQQGVLKKSPSREEGPVTS